MGQGSSTNAGNSNNNNNNEDLLSLQECEDVLQSLVKAESLADLVKMKAELEKALRSVVEIKGDVGKKIRASFINAVKERKAALSPINRSDALKELTQKYLYAAAGSEERLNFGKQYVALARELSGSEEGVEFARTFGALEAETSRLVKMNGGAGRSNRAKRAKAASTVFTKYAGLLKIEGAEVDKFGNAKGTQYDLGEDGKFDGLRVVILQLYSFDIEPPVAALRQKGFDVTVIKSAPGLAKLKELAETASQIWVISDSSKRLSDEEVEFLAESWRNGASMYIWGDNDPFYFDANRLLKAMFPDSGMLMRGNHIGSQPVSVCPDGAHVGFVPHFLTTGLVSLYEGVTVASVDSKVVKLLDFDPVLYDHEGNLIVVSRKAQDGCGSIIIDGAFTKLYCSWDSVPGNSRFVRNCACWLSAMLEDEGGVVDPGQQPEEVPQLNWDNCLKGTCDISFEDDQPLSILATCAAAYSENTSDFVLDNALGVGPQNVGAFGKQAYGFNVAKLFLESGKDPFRRVDVDAIIPCVSLADPVNRQIMADLLCSVLMQGASMPQKAFFLLLAVADSNLVDQDCERREVWSFFEKEITTNVLCTPLFTDVGEKVPLIDAMQTFLLDEGCLNKTFAFLATVVRVLKRRKVPIDELALRIVLKRSALRILSSSVLSSFKNRGWEETRNTLEGLVYNRCLGVMPLRGTGKRPAMLDAYGTFVASAEALLADINRTSAVVHSDRLIDDEEIATIVLLLLDMEAKEFSVSSSKLVDRLREFPTFAEMWKSPVAPANLNSVAAAEKRLGGFVDCKGVHEGVSPFETCFGPSVFRCICGIKFGDPATVDTNDKTQVEELKLRRNAHFRDVYGADVNGYPTATSAHCSLHRAVQRVMTSEEFAKSSVRTEDMEKAVLKYLRKHSKGDIYYPNIANDIKFLIDSYLQLRAKGFAEPGNGEPIDFAKRAEREKDLHKK